MSKARDIADLDFNSPDIDGGNIDGATIGASTPAAGTFNIATVDGARIVVQRQNDDASIAFANNNSGTPSGNTWAIGLDYDQSESLTFAFATNGFPSLSGNKVFQMNQNGNATFTGDVTVPYLATTSYVDLNNSGNRGKIGFDSNHTYIATSSSVGSIIFKNNVGSTAAPQTGGDTLLTLADGGDATFSGTISSGAITSGAHLINASSSLFGSSSVQGFNTDFLVDSGQGYSRHNSYHTGGSNHQFLVNATGSTTNAIAFELSKDKNARFNGNVTIDTPSVDTAILNIHRQDHASIPLLQVLQDSSVSQGTGHCHINSANRDMSITAGETPTLDKTKGLYITTTGKTGFGLTSPSRRRLEIQDATPGIVFHDSDTTNLTHEIVGGGNAGLEISADYQNVANGYVRFDVGGTERARIRENGSIINVIDGKTFFRICDTFTATAQAVTKFAIDLATTLGASTAGQLFYKVTAGGYASGGANGCNMTYTVAGYSGHNYSSTNYASLGAGTINNGYTSSGSSSTNAQGLSYHPAINLGAYIANGRILVYVPGAQEYGVTVQNDSNQGMSVTVTVEGYYS